jgi:hypothetical protein
MEKGFFHPDRGYWQTIGDPSAATLNTYPEGTVEVPLKPAANMEWDGKEWVEVAPPPPVPQELAFAQLLIGLVAEGWITEAEGEAWLEGRIPAAAELLIATLPEDQRFAARARAARPSTVLRTDPLVIALAASQGHADDLDRFFTTYAAV